MCCFITNRQLLLRRLTETSPEEFKLEVQRVVNYICLTVIYYNSYHYSNNLNQLESTKFILYKVFI